MQRGLYTGFGTFSEVYMYFIVYSYCNLPFLNWISQGLCLTCSTCTILCFNISGCLLGGIKFGSVVTN